MNISTMWQKLTEKSSTQASILETQLAQEQVQHVLSVVAKATKEKRGGAIFPASSISKKAKQSLQEKGFLVETGNYFEQRTASGEYPKITVVSWDGRTSAQRITAVILTSSLGCTAAIGALIALCAGKI